MLGDTYPAKPPFFQAGLVVTTSHVMTFSHLNIQLAEYEPARIHPNRIDPVESPWRYGN